MKLEGNFHPDTIAIHAGQTPDPTTGAVMTPIYQTSTYVQESPGVNKGYEYGRSQNLTRFALEANLAALEEAEFGLSFSSGCAAMANVIHLFQKGDHIVVCDDVYGGTLRLFTKVFEKSGYEFTFVDLTQFENLEKSIKPQTKLVWIETPTNPLLKVLDIARISEFAKKKGILTLVDNTFLSPYLQQPLKFGADLVLHSTTKYIGGHSDVVGGFVGTSNKKLFEELKFLQKSIGAVPSPLDCFLQLRGTKTLHLRMQRHCENAMQLAEWLTTQPQIEKVSYPGLKSHPQHELAKKQSPKGFGGMITIVVKGGLPAAKTLLSKVKIFACAESLGGVESLIQHPAIMTHASVPPAMREKLGITDGLIRISVGVEHIEDLKKDLAQALASL